MKRFILLLALIVVASALLAQNSYFRRQEALIHKGNYEQAAIEYEKFAIKAEKPGQAPPYDLNFLYNRLGECFLYLKKYAKAELYLTKAYDRGVRDIAFLLNYGDVLLANDKPDRAVVIYQQVLQASPENAKVLDHINKAQFNIKSKNDPRGRLNPVSFETKLNTRNNSQYALAWYKDLLVFSSDRSSVSGSAKPKSKLFYAVPMIQGDWGTMRRFGPFKPVAEEHALAFDGQTQTCYVERTIGKSNNSDIYSYQVDLKGKFINRVPQSFHDPNANIEHPTLSSDGKVMFFTIFKDGRRDIYMAKKIGNCNYVWTTPQKLSSVINTDGDECYPQLYRDSILFFASNGHSGMGGMDIFFAKIAIDGVVHAISGNSDLNQLEFSTPVNLEAPINSGADDFTLLMNQNGKGGLLTSNRSTSVEGRNQNDIYSFFQWPYALDGPVKFATKPLASNTVPETATVVDKNDDKNDQEKEDKLNQLRKELEAAKTQLTNNQPPAKQDTQAIPEQPKPQTQEPPAKPVPQLPVVQASDPGIRYRVQLMATSTPIEDYAEVFSKLLQAIPYLKLEILVNVDNRFQNYYHYVTPAYITMAEAVAIRDRIKKFADSEAADEKIKELGLERCFIATFEGGRRVSIQMR